MSSLGALALGWVPPARAVVYRPDYEDTEGGGCLDSVPDVQVMEEGAGPVFERVHRGIGADVIFTPVETCPIFVVGLASRLVIHAVISEDCAGLVEPITTDSTAAPTDAVATPVAPGDRETGQAISLAQ